MYATVRRYEGVTDPSEVAWRVNEEMKAFCPLSAKSKGSWITTSLMPETV
jgi:hypothetical protein